MYLLIIKLIDNIHHMKVEDLSDIRKSGIPGKMLNMDVNEKTYAKSRIQRTLKCPIGYSNNEETKKHTEQATYRMLFYFFVEYIVDYPFRYGFVTVLTISETIT